MRLTSFPTFIQNILNPAAKAPLNKSDSETCFWFVCYNERDTVLKPSDPPDLLLINGLTVVGGFTRQKVSTSPRASVSYLICNEVSRMPLCSTILHRRFSDVFSLLLPTCQEPGASYTCAHDPSPESTFL